MDTFVRSYMDEAGFVPLPLLCTYQNVAAYGAPYFDVVERLNELTAERKIEFDPSNETVRLKVGWENVSNILKLSYLFVFAASIVYHDDSAIHLRLLTLFLLSHYLHLHAVADAQRHRWQGCAQIRQADPRAAAGVLPAAAGHL